MQCASLEETACMERVRKKKRRLKQIDRKKWEPEQEKKKDSKFLYIISRCKNMFSPTCDRTSGDCLENIFTFGIVRAKYKLPYCCEPNHSEWWHVVQLMGFDPLHQCSDFKIRKKKSVNQYFILHIIALLPLSTPAPNCITLPLSTLS